MNNRQNGRRRGRGGQQTRNGQPGSPSTGNRLDNRARGNAAQLLEKYKALARDAQTQSDRVNTEYYLQFADHYFRILNENRVRFEEQRRGRDDFEGGDGAGADQQGYQSNDDNGDDNWDDDADPLPEYRQPERQPERQQADRQPERQQQDRPQQDRQQQDRQPDRQPRPRRDDRPQQQPPQGEAPAEAPRAAPRERRPYVRDNREQPAVAKSYAAPETVTEDEAPARIEIDLPPSISGGDIPVEAEAAPKRRRTRRPRAETSVVDA